MNKKGVIDNLNPLITGLVITGMLLVIAFLFFAEVASNATVAADSNATAAVGAVQNAMAGIPGWLPIIIIVVIGALLIGLVQLIRRN